MKRFLSLTLCMLIGFATFSNIATAVDTITATLSATYVLVGGTAEIAVKDETGATVTNATFVSQNTAIATVDSNGVVTGVAAGETTVTVTTATASTSVTIPVKKNLNYNYWKLSTAAAYGGDYVTYGNQHIAISTVTSFDKTTAGDSNEIYSKRDYPNTIVVTDPWCYVGRGGGASNFEFIDYAYALMLQQSVGAWAKIKIRVPTDGIYKASTINGYYTGGGIIRTYLAPENVADPTAPEYSLGVIDTYSSSQNWKLGKGLGTRSLTAGDYILTYEILGKNPANTGTPKGIFGNFKLNVKNSFPSMDVTASALSTLRKNASADAVLSSNMSDGSAQDLYAATITATPRDASVAAAEVVTSADKMKRSVRVTGVNAGSTTVDVSVSLNGQVVDTLEIPVTVELGTLTSATLAVSDSASGRIARNTAHPINLTLLDDATNVIPNIAAEVSYQVDPASAAVVSDGSLHALSCGTATVTATATINNVTKSATTTVNICDSGENLMSDRNWDFEGNIGDANWDWSGNYATPADTSTLTQWSEVGTQERDGNTGNKAMSVVLNPNIAPNKSITYMLKSNTSGRVKLEPGKLYEFSVWVKTDNLTSPDGTMLDCGIDLYDYNGSESSAGTFPAGLFRNPGLKSGLFGSYPDSFAGWKKITLPVAAPTNCDGELWVTPRLMVRHPNYSTVTQTGYGGKIWFDDFELREVGYDHVEATLSAPLTTVGDTSTLNIQPYATTGTKVSMLSATRAAEIPNFVQVTSDDTNVVTAGTVTRKSSSDGNAYGSSTLTLIGEGSADVTVNVTINGVTKNAVSNVGTGDLTFTDNGAIRATATDSSTGGAVPGTVLTSSEPSFVQNDSNSLAIGTEITLLAAPVEGKTFMYWKNVPSNRIVSTNQSYSFKVGSNTYLTAVYSEPQSGQVLVEFCDKNGKVLQSNYLDKNAAITTPTNPYTVGYSFAGWSPTVPSNADKDYVFTAQYSALPVSYQVTAEGPAMVVGGNLSPYAYNDKITLTVDDASVPAGQSFQYWTRDGKIVSYDTTYSFYVWDNTVVKAVCSAVSAGVKPQVMMDTVKIDGNRIIFMAERTVPDGFDIIETGIILKSGSGSANTLKISGGSYDLKAVAQSTDKNGQFTVRKDNASGIWYARAYVIYKDSQGNCKIAYSNIVNGIV